MSKMLIDEAAVKLALDALEVALNKPMWDRLKMIRAITAIKEALALPEHEPVAWQFFEGGKWHNGMEVNDHRKHTIAAGTPVRDLYTTPPQRKPLTDEEMADFLGDRYHIMTEDELEFFRLGEAAHGIKENT